MIIYLVNSKLNLTFILTNIIILNIYLSYLILMLLIDEVIQ